MSREENDATKKESVNEREETVLRYWQEHEIFEKSIAKNDGKEPYVFYDGPPFATGLPHYGHLLAGTIKDVIPRYQTMRGRHVRREWGWDCHGLPIENLIEKALGLEHKKQIEEYGVEKFNEKARQSVLEYDKEWKEIVPRMGRWVDMKLAYKTMDSSYTESIWWAFKTLYDKKLIYEGRKSMHICPRCETTLAISEVGMNYKDIKDISVYVKFELVDEPGTFLLAWTTTPWTLPGNVAVAVHPDIEYVSLVHEGAKYIIAKERVPHVFKDKAHEIIEEIKGKELIGKKYKPLFDYYTGDEKLENRENGWKVCAADFVTTESGTGIVHEAPAFGEEDMELAKKLGLPVIQHVAMDGRIKPEVKEFAGLHAKPKDDHTRTDVEVIKYLAGKGILFAKEKIEHSYPHCWRCDWPLLNYAASSWFVDVTRLKPKLIEENKEIAWIPEHMKEGRFGKWLEGARDWAISRSRYWGAPLPVWKCNKCGNVEALGSLADLRQRTTRKNRFLVMRHGEAENNIKGVVSYKMTDQYGLTEKGVKQVKERLSELKKMHIDFIVSSPLMRTKQTAEMVRTGLGLPDATLSLDARLSEVNTGEFNGTPIENYRTYFTTTLEKFTRATPGGETLQEMKQRLADILYELDRKNEGKTILIVTHEYGEWLLEAAAKGMTNEEASWLRFEGGDDFIKNAEVRELRFAEIPHNDHYELDYHRPYIDRITYQCTCGLGNMERIGEVFDCWFESGAMPFAQFHFMGDETTPEGKAFSRNFPADFIAEGMDQTRGWFYTMLILSTALFDRAAYKSVIVNGLILAEDGQKMSKKLKNYPDPMEVVRRYGADALRFYMLSSPVVRGEELRFATTGVDEVYKKLVARLENVRAFYALFAGTHAISREAPDVSHILDRWMLARWHETHAEVTHYLDTHDLDRASRPILPLVDDLSTWYLRRSRERLKSENPEERDAAEATLGWILFQTSKLLAPFTPFMAEDLYLRLHIEGKKESVHLEEWPSMGVAPSNILEQMAEVRSLVQSALELRAKHGVKVRQPLSTLSVRRTVNWPVGAREELEAIIRDEVNVKEIHWGAPIELDVELDTMITVELKEEGDLREIIRLAQDARKSAGLVPSETAKHLAISGSAEMIAVAKKHEAQLQKVVRAETITLSEGDLGAVIEQ